VLRLIAFFFSGAVTLLLGFMGGAWYAQTLPLSVLVPGTVQAADHISPSGKPQLAASSSATLSAAAGPAE
jgi:hypothetical protein